MARTRILLSDDHAGVIESVTSLIDNQFDVAGFVLNGTDLVEAAARLNPDVIILDISMPGLNGIEAASRIRRSGSTAKLIFLTVHDDPDFVSAAFSAGARGYVLKPRMYADLVAAIKKVLAGATFVSSRVLSPQ